MRIDRLRTHNFRSFEDQTFTFDSDFTVLIGRNGTGKTAALDALAIACGTWLHGIGGQQAPTIKRSDVRLVGRSFHGETSYEEQYGVEVEAWGGVQGEWSTSWIRELRTRGGRTTNAGARHLIRLASEAEQAVRRGDAATVLPAFAYYGAGRLWERTRDRRRRVDESKTDESRRATSRLAGYNESMDRRTNARDFVRWMERQDRISYQRSEQTLFYRMVRRAAASMLEEVSDVRFDKDREEVVAEFQDGRLTPFSMLSDGQRNMLAMAGDLAMRMVQLNLPLGEEALERTPGVVLIDEIDLHLHPAWQRHIVDDLRQTFPLVQFIASTHSPFIIQSLHPGELIDLDPGQQPVPEEYVDRSIEDIAEIVMDVELPQKSLRYVKMMAAAERYYSLLHAGASEQTVEAARLSLDEAAVPFSDDPAFQALLTLERKKRLST